LRRLSKISVATAALMLAITGCAAEEEPTPGDGEAVKVGLAYDVGGRGDQSFNDSAAVGLDKAKAEFGVEAAESEAADGEAESAREERLIQMAEAGYNPVIAVGFAYSPAVNKVAPDFPEVSFGVIDGSDPDADPATGEIPADLVNENVAYLGFAEHEGSFLVGAAAALKSKTGNVGFIGGVNVPLILKFEAGFEAGAKAANPDIEIQSTYLTQPPDFSGFGDPAKGKAAAEGQFDGGADVVYQVAGGSGLGVFQAAKAAKGLAIGVDSDQYNTVPANLQSVIMTSMLKRVDVAVYNFIKSLADGAPLTGFTTFDLKAGGVDYSKTGGQVDDIASKLDEYKAQIIDGTITVPSTK